MKNKISVLLLVLTGLLIILLTTPISTGAQDTELPTFEEDVIIDFGESIKFTLSVDTLTEPIRIGFFYRTSQDSQFEAQIVEIISARPYRASIDFAPRSINLLPFSQIEHFWQVDFADGTSISTQADTHIYADDRYTWQDLPGDDATIHWVEGDIEWAQDVYAIAEESLPEMRRVLALPPTTPHQIYVYPSEADLQNSLRQVGINQASAHALPELGVVLVAGDDDPEALIRLEQTVPHELVHLLLYERMGPAIANVPAWLNEGLAMQFEQSPRRIYSAALIEAAEQEELLQIESLCTSFPIEEEGRVLAYAQSASFTNYLLDVYGTGGIARLLDAYEEGTTCIGGIQRVYQRSIDQLESEWRMTTIGSGTPFWTLSTLIALFTAIGLITAAVSVYWLRRRRHSISKNSQ